MEERFGVIKMIIFIVWLLGVFFFCGLINDTDVVFSFFWPITMPCSLAMILGEWVGKKLK